MLRTPPARPSESTTPEDHLREPLSSLSVELSRISAEIQSINSGFQAQFQQALSESQTAIASHYNAQLQKTTEESREQLRKELSEELRKEFEAELRKRVPHLEEVRKEIARVGGRLEGVSREIATMIDDPSVELSRVMRKKAEQSELQAYLNGLRYSIGENDFGR